MAFVQYSVSFDRMSFDTLLLSEITLCTRPNMSVCFSRIPSRTNAFMMCLLIQGCGRRVSFRNATSSIGPRKFCPSSPSLGKFGLVGGGSTLAGTLKLPTPLRGQSAPGMIEPLSCGLRAGAQQRTA